MNKDLAAELLRNLIERASDTTQKAFVTSLELTALRVILAETEIGDQTGAPSVSSPEASQSSHSLAPLVIGPEDIQANLIVCVDFGTSFSKAFATMSDGDDHELIDLPLGDGSTGNSLTTPSELFIDGERIYFGPSARRRMDAVGAEHRLLIDSIKQFITLEEDVGSLALKPVGDRDPSKLFTKRDVLTLYLGHLMALTEDSLAARDLPINARRRFTHPAWKEAVKAPNTKAMHRLMAEAIVLARSSDSLRTDISVGEARRLLDGINAFTDELLPMALVFEPVREATAAGAGALIDTPEGRRETYVIVDIGAGTTDVAAFVCAYNPEKDRPVVSEVSSAANALAMAGNNVDQMLQNYILSQSSLSADSEEYRAAAVAISRSRRQYKEELFRSGEVLIQLPTDELVRISLEEFIATRGMKAFNEQIRTLIAQSAAIAAGDQSRVRLVATGGGATLPIIQEVAQSGVEAGGKHVQLVLVEAISEEIAESYPDLVGSYTQIAVAVGGALPNLPQQTKDMSVGISSAPQYTLSPMYR